jgi:hypothetical protein
MEKTVELFTLNKLNSGTFTLTFLLYLYQSHLKIIHYEKF